MGRQRVSNEAEWLRGRTGKEKPHSPRLLLAEVQTQPCERDFPDGDFEGVRGCIWALGSLAPKWRRGREGDFQAEPPAGPKLFAELQLTVRRAHGFLQIAPNVAFVLGPESVFGQAHDDAAAIQKTARNRVLSRLECCEWPRNCRDRAKPRGG